MSLAIEPIGLSLTPGTSFAEGFEPHLRSEYSKLAALHGGFPRVIPLPNDHPAYIKNALECLMQFWKRGLSSDEWRRFVADLAISGEVMNWQLRQVAPNATGADDLRFFEEQQTARLKELRKTEGRKKRLIRGAFIPQLSAGRAAFFSNYKMVRAPYGTAVLLVSTAIMRRGPGKSHHGFGPNSHP